MNNVLNKRLNSKKLQSILQTYNYKVKKWNKSAEPFPGFLEAVLWPLGWGWRGCVVGRLYAEHAGPRSFSLLAFATETAEG